MTRKHPDIMAQNPLRLLKRGFSTCTPEDAAAFAQAGKQPRFDIERDRRAEPAPMLLGFIIGPMMEEYLRRALLLSHSDLLVFVQRPIRATMLVMAAIAMAVLLPSLRKKREEAFQEDCCRLAGCRTCRQYRGNS